MQNSSVVAVLIAGKVAKNETKTCHERHDTKSVTFTKLKRFVNFMMENKILPMVLKQDD